MANMRVPYNPGTPTSSERIPERASGPVRLTWSRQPMVQWFDPKQLAHTGIRALLSSIFGAYADQREIQAALSHGDEPAIHDYSSDDELWIDYAADLGDGFDSTYTVAWLLGRSTLPPRGPDASSEENEQSELLAATERGHVLILGGDQVYPTASRAQYENRFSGPFEAALPWVDDPDRPHMFAVPGNHDWYDGLTSFMRLFCQRHGIGGWVTQQTRSYFAIKLPHRWWLLGIDIQLSSHVDQPQLDYFAHVAEQIQPGDHVILCTAQPAWVEGGDNSAAYRNLAFFERTVIAPRRAKLMVTLTGDLHHYARYADATGERHKITAGGGGAYLYGTQCLPDEIELTNAAADEEGRSGTNRGTTTYRRTAEYPERAVSRRLRLGALRLLFKNPGFVLFLGITYLMCGWLLQSASQGSPLRAVSRAKVPANTLMHWLSTQQFNQIGHVFAKLLEVTLQVPVLAVIAGMLVFGLYKFCEPDPGRPRWFRWIGAVHGVMHLALILLLTWAFAHLNAPLDQHGSVDTRLWLQGAAYIAEMVVVGGLAGAFLFSLALLPGVNFNEAYSAQHIEDYKNFLRLNVEKSGALTIYPIGIERVTRWEIDPSASAREPYFRPRDGVLPRVHLIEQPITVPAPTAPGVVAQGGLKESDQAWNISTR